MIKYIKDSLRELKHVVWPTREETNNYFLTVVLVLLVFGIYLFIASTIFTKWLFGLKDIVDNNTTSNTTIIPKNKVVSDEGKAKVDTSKVDSVKVVTKDDKKVEVSTGITK